MMSKHNISQNLITLLAVASLAACGGSDDSETQFEDGSPNNIQTESGTSDSTQTGSGTSDNTQTGSGTSDSTQTDSGTSDNTQTGSGTSDNTQTGSGVSDNASSHITYTAVGITASLEQSEKGNVAAKAIDGDSSESSVWSGNSDEGDVWLDVDLGEIQTVNTVKIEFKKPLDRNFCFSIYTSTDGTTWDIQRENITSYGNIFYSINETDTRFVRYEGYGNSSSGWNSITEIAAMDKEQTGDEDISHGTAGICDTDLSVNESNYANQILSIELQKSPLTTGTGASFTQNNDIDATKSPGENFDLSLWKITYPDASEVQPPAVIDNEFYTDSSTGAMVFQCPNYGSTTSSSTKYSRTELREMLNADAGTKELGNNWVNSLASTEDQASAGGIDGNMKATVSVDQVSTTTDVDSEYMVGRVIVGQIHASEDEPFKVYYRLLPGHTKGFVYFAYEDSTKEIFYPMIGETGFTIYGSDLTAAEPVDGIELGEKWSYEVDVVGRDMTVTITKADGSWVARTITWSSEYDSDWFYFKAGAYNQNNGGEVDQFAKVSFYSLAVSHN